MDRRVFLKLLGCAVVVPSSHIPVGHRLYMAGIISRDEFVQCYSGGARMGMTRHSARMAEVD